MSNLALTALEAMTQGALSTHAARGGRKGITDFTKMAPKGMLNDSITDSALHSAAAQNYYRNRILKELNQGLNPMRWDPLSLASHLVGSSLDARGMQATDELAKRLKTQRAKADVLSVAAPAGVVGAGTAGYLLGKRRGSRE